MSVISIVLSIYRIHGRPQRGHSHSNYQDGRARKSMVGVTGFEPATPTSRTNNRLAETDIVIHSTSVCAESCHPGRPQLDQRRGQFRESLDLLPGLLRKL